MSKSPEQRSELSKDPLFAELLTVSDKFLGDAAQRPGSDYRPIIIPLSELFKRDEKPIIVGYRVTDQHKVTDMSAVTPETVSELSGSGLIRYRTSEITVSQWPGTLILKEFTAAHLQRRQVTPSSDSKVFQLDVLASDSEGRQTFPHESFLYSTEQGLIDHTSRRLPTDLSEQEILNRAVHWLSGQDADAQ